MATKPTFVFTWASDALYTNGPALLVGTPTKISPSAAKLAEGWNADEVPPAQWQNFILNDYSGWVVWVNAASPIATADTHLVETDAQGETAVVDVTAGGNRQAPSALGWYGDGDFDHTVVGTESLTQETHYQNLTVPNGTELRLQGNRIFVKETLTIEAGGVISCDGLPGQDGGMIGNGIDDAALGGLGANQVALGGSTRIGALGRGGEGGEGGDGAGSPAFDGKDGETVDWTDGASGGTGGAGFGAGSSGGNNIKPPLNNRGTNSAHSGANGFTQGGFTGGTTANGYPEGLLNGGTGGGGGGGHIQPA